MRPDNFEEQTAHFRPWGANGENPRRQTSKIRRRHAQRLVHDALTLSPPWKYFDHEEGRWLSCKVLHEPSQEDPTYTVEPLEGGGQGYPVAVKPFDVEEGELTHE